MFVRPEKAVSEGPKAWAPGERLWDLHLQGPKWLTRLADLLRIQCFKVERAAVGP